MLRFAIFAVLLLGARMAEADCRYQNGYYDPGFDGACVAETSAPAGCPVHFVTPRAQERATFTVHRGTQDITLPATTAVVETVGVPMSLVDPVDCDCTRTDATVLFDRQALMLTGARPGDTVELASGHLYAPQIVAITAAVPACPAVAWPARIELATQCDLCPRQSPASSSSGCSTSRDGSWFAAVIALGLAACRRRRARRPAPASAPATTGTRARS
jgi:MYXO-CTERM domain-containing protein